MITSIKIINHDEVWDNITGCPIIEAPGDIRVSAQNSVIRVDSAPRSEHPYLPNTRDPGYNLPYVSSITGIRPNQYGSVYILSDLTSQIDDHDEHGIAVCDMSQDNRYPQIFRGIYDMLTILRRWIDGHKDSILLKDTKAQDQWGLMLDDDAANDYYKLAENPAPYPLYVNETGTELLDDSRNRVAIPAMNSAIDFIHEYQSVVALWNYIVASPEAIFKVRVHPADNAGIYIGFALNVPVPSPEDLDILVTISITCSGQAEALSGDTEGGPLYIWLRSPDAYSSVTPEPESGGFGDIILPEEVYKATGDVYSILDEEGRIMEYSGGIFKVSYPITIPKPSSGDMRTVYTIQTILEAIPFCMCGNEDTYSESLQGNHYVHQEENSWTVSITCSMNGEDIFSGSSTKKTQYAMVCSDPYVSDDETGG